MVEAARNLIISESTHEWRVEKIDKEDGIRMFIEGAEFPQKGCPTPEAVWANNILKKVIVEGSRVLSLPQFVIAVPLFVFSSKRKLLNKVLQSFNIIADRIMWPYYLPTQEMGTFSRELELFTSIFLISLGVHNEIDVKGKNIATQFAKNIAHIFEYDAAYRWRVQDLLSETNAEAVLSLREIKRLKELFKRRERVGRLTTQMDIFFLLFMGTLLLPSIRKALKESIQTINFKKLQFDEGDRYWCCFRTDYDFFGLTDKQRMQMIADKGWKVPISYPVSR